MRLLFDNNMPDQLRPLLRPHLVIMARQLGWAELENGDLIRVAELQGFEVLITNDKGIFYQQDNRLRRISLIHLSNVVMSNLRPMVPALLATIAEAKPNSFVRIDVPMPPKRRRPITPV